MPINNVQRALCGIRQYHFLSGTTFRQTPETDERAVVSSCELGYSKPNCICGVIGWHQNVFINIWFDNLCFAWTIRRYCAYI